MGLFKLTKNKISQEIKGLERNKDLADGNGLYLNLSAANKGAGTWYLLTKNEAGKVNRNKIGYFNLKFIDKEELGYLSLEQARQVAEQHKAAREYKERLKKQEQSAVALEEELLQNKVTFAQAFELYEELNSSKLAASTTKNNHQKIKQLTALGLYHYPLEEFSNNLLREKLAPLHAQGKHATIRNLITFINMVKHKACELELTGALNKHRPDLLFDLKQGKMREYLQPSDLPEFFERVKVATLSQADKLLLCAIILTACRFNEVFEFNPDELVQHPVFGLLWEIPPERMKGKRRHTLLLDGNEILTKVIYKVQELRGDFTRSSQSNIGKAIKICSGQNITIHGFRSTFATLLNSLYPYKMKEISLCLAHKLKYEGHADERYNRYEYVREKGEVYKIWSDYLLENTCIADIIN